MQAMSETEISTDAVIEEKEKKSPVVRINGQPTKENIRANTILITMSFPDSTSSVWTLHLEDVDGIDVESLSLLEITVLLTDMGVLPDSAIIVSVFKVKEITEGAVFPLRNEEVYVRPYFDEDGVITYYEMMAKNNKDYFVFWNIEDGFEVRDSLTGTSLLYVQEVNAESPHFIGKDAFLLIESETNTRILFSVYSHEDWKVDEWNYVVGSMLGMCYGAVNGYSFIIGVTEVEEINYSNRLMQDINSVETYRLSVTDKENESTAVIELDADCIVLRCH